MTVSPPTPVHLVRELLKSQLVTAQRDRLNAEPEPLSRPLAARSSLAFADRRTWVTSPELAGERLETGR
jgi:hypothetical protein